MTATIAPPRPGAPGPAQAARTVSVRRAEGGGASNLGLAALTLSSVVALSRLFTKPGTFFFPVAAVAVSVHLAAWASRRARLELLPSAAISAVSGLVVTSWVALGHTTAYGVPWRGTYHALGPALQVAATAYRSTAAPTEVLSGFIVCAAFGVGCAAFLGDWAVFRMRATTEACLPSFSLLVLSAALAQGHGTVEAATVYLSALLVFLLTRQGALDGPATAWFASRSRHGSGSVIATGTLVAVAAVAAIATLGPHLPGATTHAVIDWRHGTSGNAGRSTGSPLVDVKDRLHDESQQEVFTVKAPQASYWRMTALDDFNGTGWSLNDTYRRTGAKLAAPSTGLADDGPTRAEDATFRVSSLDSLWLPAAYRPVHIIGARGVSYSAEAASLITSKSTSDGTTYTVESAVPTVTPTQLAQIPPVSFDDPTMAPYLQLPADLDPEVRALARDHTIGASSPYQEALDLQDWLRGPSFRYSLNVAADDSPHALVDFLTLTRAGFCQQFAASFAALGRTIGLPTRVAVGFTPGDLESDGLYHVRDDDAHAWPEVYFQRVGWIAFEPTPGRGSPDPAAQAITGQKPAQAANPAPTAAAPGGPTTTSAAAGATPAAPRTSPRLGAGTASRVATHRHHGHGLLLVVAALAAAIGVWILGLWLLTTSLQARRRARAADPPARIAVAWREAGEALALAGAPSRPWETPAEFARRAAVDADLGDIPRVALASLAAAFEVAAYAPSGPDEAAVTSAQAAAEVIRAEVTGDRRWWRRLLALVDPRPAWRAVSLGA